MGLGSFLGGACRAIGSALSSGISRVCSLIGGSALGSALSSAVSRFVGVVATPFPALEIAKVIVTVAQIIVKVAEALGLKETEKDEPEELAYKAEKSDKKPDDFDSTEEYIRHLQDDIELSEEDKKKLEEMDEDELSAYRATGTYIYTKGINEKLGFDTEGMKHPELVGLTAELIADLVKLAEALTPQEFVAYSKGIRDAGMTLTDLADYLHGRSGDISTAKKVQDVIVGAMKEMKPEITQEDINRKLYEMNMED